MAFEKESTPYPPLPVEERAFSIWQVVDGMGRSSLDLANKI